MKKQVNILEFGAVSGSKELQTEKIQAAIDACRDGGGEVVIPAGEWHTAVVSYHPASSQRREADCQRSLGGLYRLPCAYQHGLYH